MRANTFDVETGETWWSMDNIPATDTPRLWSSEKCVRFCAWMREAYPLVYAQPTFAYMRHWYSERMYYDGGFELNGKKFHKTIKTARLRRIVKQFEIVEKTRERLGVA